MVVCGVAVLCVGCLVVIRCDIVYADHFELCYIDGFNVGS